jgi:alpha,alpha-trehalose phosphorylase
MANLGGSYLCVIGGFAGLIIDEEGVSLSPVLPEKWRGYSFRFIYQGSVFDVSVTAERTLVTRISGEAQKITVNGTAGYY